MKEKLWRTKTFWGGIAAIATGVGLALTGDIPEGLNSILLGFGLIFGRHALTKGAAK